MAKKEECLRCKIGKGYYIGDKIIYIGRDGSCSIDTKTLPILDLPKGTFKYCPFCSRELAILRSSY